MRALRAAVLALCACCPHPAAAADAPNGGRPPQAEKPAEPMALPAGSSAPAPLDATAVPGREPPASAPLEDAYIIKWETYHSLIIVGPGAGKIRPAYVLTYQDTDSDEVESGTLVVAYRAMAFRDARGVLHADARNAMEVGPLAKDWKPDSFAIFASGTVDTLDDLDRGQSGVVTRVVDTTHKDYAMMLLSAEAVVGEGL